MDKTRNSELLASFSDYCKAHPDQRFWQAIRNWSGEPYIVSGSTPPVLMKARGQDKEVDALVDTFYWEGKNS